MKDHCTEQHPLLQDESCLAAIAPEWPHDCDVPGCPGPQNKRKLEKHQALLEAAQGALFEFDAMAQGWNVWGGGFLRADPDWEESRRTHIEKRRVALRAALARKETA